MKIARLLGLLLVVILATSLMSVSAASAASSNPLFIPANGQAATGSSGVSSLTAAGNVITCQRSAASGNITSSLLVGKVIVRYLECSSTLGAERPCTVKSKASGLAGLLITKELHGILGLLLPSNTTGILFLPTAPPTFVEIEEGEKGTGTQKCTPQTNVTGNVAGEVTPVGSSVLEGKITFPEGRFKEIDLTHGIGKRPVAISAFTEPGTLKQEETVKYEEKTEVT